MMYHNNFDNLQKSINESHISNQQDVEERNSSVNLDNQAINRNPVDITKIEADIKKVLSDRKRMANFQQVIACASLYEQATTEEEKLKSLVAIRQSATDYLLRRKNSSSIERKNLCERLISSIDEYAGQKNVSVTHDTTYMLDGRRYLTTDEINNEITLAHDLVSNKPLGRVTTERRESFKRKLADVKTANGYLSEIDKWKNKKRELLERKRAEDELPDGVNEFYDDAVMDTILWYGRANTLKDEAMTTMLERMKADDINDAEGYIKLKIKARQIETILFDIMSWNMADFTFAKTDDFLHRKEKGESEKEHFLKLYSKLQVAKNGERLLGELLRLCKRFDAPLDFSDKTMAELKVRLKIYKEIEKDYSERLDLMSSPYYALLQKNEMEAALTAEDDSKLRALKGDKAISGSGVKRKVPPEFSKYIDKLLLKKKRMDETKVTDFFARQKDIEDSIATNLKKKNIYTKERKNRLTREGNEVRNTLAQDVLELKAYKEGDESVQSNKAKKQAPGAERQNIANSMQAVQGRSFVPVERPDTRMGFFGKLKNYGLAGARWIFGATLGVVGAVVGKAVGAPKQLQESERVANAQKKRIHGIVPGTKDERFDDENISDSDEEENILFDYRRFPLVWEKMTAGDPESPPEVTIMTEQSIRGQRGADIYKGMGHAMIGLSYSRYNRATRRKERYQLRMGFYPGGGLTNINRVMMATGALMQGQIRNDEEHHFDIARKYKVKPGDINRIIKATETYADGGYGYYKRNCATYVTDMAKLANLPVAGETEIDTIDFNGVISNLVNVAAGGAAFAKDIAANDIADKFQKDDLSYENFGQKMATKEELDRYYDTANSADFIRKGYSPGAMGEDLRESDKGELTAKYHEHNSIKDNEVFERNFKDAGKNLAEEIERRIRADEGRLKSYDNMIIDLLKSGNGVIDVITKEGKGVADEVRARHKKISEDMRNLNEYYAKRLKQDHLLNEPFMKYLSLCEVALSLLDEAYINNIGKEYKGDAGYALESFESDYDLTYVPKNGDSSTFGISPMLYLGYLKMGKSVSQIAKDSMEFIRVDHVGWHSISEEEKRNYRRIVRDLSLATALGRASQYNLYKEEFNDKDLDYAFSELPMLEFKKEAGERLVGEFFGDHRPSYIYQTAILEKVFSGLGSLNFSEKETDIDKVKVLDDFLFARMNEKSDFMKKILSAFVKGQTSSNPDVLMVDFVGTGIVAYIKSALFTAGFDKKEVRGITNMILDMTKTTEWIKSAIGEVRNS